MTPEQRLLILDTWPRSGLPAGDFAPLVGLSKHTLYSWKKRFDESGPAGLMDQQRGGAQGQPRTRADQADDPHAQAGQPGVGLPADQRHAAPRSGPAGLAGGRLPRAARGGLPGGRSRHPPAPRQAARVRAGDTQSTLADGPLHLRAQAAEPPRVHGGLHGRPQPLHHRLRDPCQPVGGPGAGGGAGGDRGLRHAAGDPHGQRQSVRHLAGHQRLPPRDGEARHQAHRGPAAASADPGQDRALLGHALAGVHRDVGVLRPGGRTAADRALHRLLQLPKGASGHRRTGACGPFLRRRLRGLGHASRGWRPTPWNWPATACPRRRFMSPGGSASGPSACMPKGKR